MVATQPPSANQLAEDLRSVFRSLKRKLLDQTGNGDLTPSQQAVILRLEASGPTTASDLARAEAMKPQSMSAILLSLQQIGFIAGSPDPQDGRKTLLSMTAACRQWQRKTRAARQDWTANRIDERLSATEQQQLARAVKLLERLIAD